MKSAKLAAKRPNRLKEWMNKRSLSQMDLAKRLGISNSYLSLIANGKRNPNIRLSLEISEMVGADLLDVFPHEAGAEDAVEQQQVLIVETWMRPQKALLDQLSSRGVTALSVTGSYPIGYELARTRPSTVMVDVETPDIRLADIVRLLKQEPIMQGTRLIFFSTKNLSFRQERQISRLIPDPEVFIFDGPEAVESFVGSLSQ